MSEFKMTMHEVKEFLDKNNFGYTASTTGQNVIESIEAFPYPPSKLMVRFNQDQCDEDRYREIRSIKAVHKVRGKELK